MDNIDIIGRIISAGILFFIGVWIGYMIGKGRKDEQQH